jgi:DNA-binding transcriptional regulator YhcF (GntR family)
MRGKDFNTGLRGVLFEAQHYERMGAAVWLYGWLVLRQTHQSGSLGFVLGGTPISYREIEEETGFNRRTLERWMQMLRRRGYIETDAAPAGVVIRITKAKKFPQATRGFAEGVRKFAEGAAQICGASGAQLSSNQTIAEPIRSSFIERSKEEAEPSFTPSDFHRQTEEEAQNRGKTFDPKPSWLGQKQKQDSGRSKSPSQRELTPQESYELIARLRRDLWRADRDEAVRRELAVGTGPEVPHK